MGKYKIISRRKVQLSHIHAGKENFKAKISVPQAKIMYFLRESSKFFQCNLQCYMAFLPFKNFWWKIYPTEVLNFLEKPIFYVLIKESVRMRAQGLNKG